MKWLKTYNNILFAVIGTLTIITLVFVAFTSLSLFSGSGPDNRGIEQDPLKKDMITENEDIDQINYYLGDPEIIDSALSTYIIVVYRPEAHEPSGSFSSSSYRSGLMINLILFDFETNQSNKLFSSVVLINHYEIIKTKNNMYLEVIYADEDTNENNIIDYDDQKCVGLYDIMNEKFNAIKLNNKYASISSIYDNRLNALIIIGENYQPNRQPDYQYYKYSLETKTVMDLDSPM